MTSALRFSARYWLTGIALAFVGVSANRLLAPLFDPRPRAIVAVAGELIALAGLGVIIFGINRRLRLAGQLPDPEVPTSSSETHSIASNAGHR
jgi:hypothetical protein